MAAYNLIGVAVCDEDGRLLGAVTVDDVLDRLLPPDWRQQQGGLNEDASCLAAAARRPVRPVRPAREPRRG